MAIRCRNGETWPATHDHSTVEESRLCWSGTFAPVSTGPVAASAVVAGPKMVTEAQLKYIEDLGGDLTYAAKLTRYDAHKYIDRLKKSRSKAKVTEPSADPKLKMIEGMISFIPDGYYATANEGEGGHVDFVRIKRVERASRKFPAGTLKIQTQHSDLWREALVLWPSGHWSIYKAAAKDMVLLVIADHKGCARRYAIEVQACQRCNKTLTDDRSRHYLIGPECEQKRGGESVIEEVDDLNAGLSFEQLVARGLPTRIWQEREWKRVS